MPLHRRALVPVVIELGHWGVVPAASLRGFFVVRHGNEGRCDLCRVRLLERVWKRSNGQPVCWLQGNRDELSCQVQREPGIAFRRTQGKAPMLLNAHFSKQASTRSSRRGSSTPTRGVLCRVFLPGAQDDTCTVPVRRGVCPRKGRKIVKLAKTWLQCRSN